MTPFFLPHLNMLGVAVVCIVPMIFGVFIAAMPLFRSPTTMLVLLLLLSLAALCFSFIPHTVVEVPYGLWFS